MAKLYFKYAAMGAGKSVELIKEAYNYKERGKNVLLISSSFDNRFGDGMIISRMGFQESATMVGIDDNLFEIIDKYKKEKETLDCVFVDEVQFLKKEQIEQLTAVVDKLAVPVICYGLRSDYRGEPFEGSCWLLTLADEIAEIRTICHCGKRATMNMRVVDGKAVFTGEQIIIGGNESYTSVCRKHFRSGDTGKQIKK